MKTYEIQIPVKPNNSSEFIFHTDEAGKFTDLFHADFFYQVLSRTNGYSILPEVEGVWQPELGRICREKMIPVRIACTSEQIAEIAEFAKSHYDQEAIFVLELGEAKFF